MRALAEAPNLPAVHLPILLPVFCLLGSAAAQGQLAPRVELTDTSILAAPRVTESSGIVPSSRARGVYWTHNDSGDGAFLYATDSAGRDLGAVRLAGAGARDWEEVVAGPCFVAPGRCLYVGDIGDNAARRSHVVIYRVREPELPHGPADTLGTTPVLDSIVITYPGRAHDAEAFVITRSGDLLLVTKDLAGPAELFRMSVRHGPRERILSRVGALSLQTGALTGRLVTGAAVSPSDSLLVVRTYVSLHFFLLRGDSLPAPLGPPDGVTIPVVEPQGEAVTFDGADQLVLTSERGQATHALLTRLRLTRQTR